MADREAEAAALRRAVEELRQDVERRQQLSLAVQEQVRDGQSATTDLKAEVQQYMKVVGKAERQVQELVRPPLGVGSLYSGAVNPRLHMH